jgi:hypothetical protein
MKNSHLFWGTLFITFGILILINNYGTMNLDWTEVWRFWPFIFILWGISLLVKNYLAKRLLVVSTALILAFTVFASFKSLFLWVGNDINIVMHDDDHSYETSTYSAESESKLSSAVLNFDAGAGSFIIKGSTDKLFSAVTEGYKDNYNFISSISGSEGIIDFSMKDTRFSVGHGKIRNKVKVELNPAPVWDMDFDLGAATINFDLSEYKTRDIRISTGASSLNLKLGSLYDTTKVYLEAGASSISISVPESSGCEILSDVSLSSKKYIGFSKLNDGKHRTGNFDTAANKIYLNIQSGISSIKVSRYQEDEEE